MKLGPNILLHLQRLDVYGNPVGEPFTVRTGDVMTIDAVPDPNHWSNHAPDAPASCVMPAQVDLSELGPPPTLEQLKQQTQTWERLTPRERTALDTIDRYSNSELSTFKDCRRKWYLTYVRNLRLKVEPGTGVRWIGDRVHRALEQWYVPAGQERTDPRDAIEQILTSDLAQLNAEARAAGREEIDLSVLAEYRKEADLQRIMVAGYMDWIEETGVDSDLVVVQPEAYLEADLPELEPVKLIAKIDVRVRRVSDDAILWLEHKTVGSFTQKLTGIQLDEQVLHQWLVESLQPDIFQTPLIGVLYNMLRRVKRGPAAKPPFYRREEIRHNRHELASFHLRVIGTIRDLWDVQAKLEAGADHREVAYPRPSGDCSWKCPFFQVCPMFDDGSRAEAALNGMYEVADPYAYYQRTGEAIE